MIFHFIGVTGRRISPNALDIDLLNFLGYEIFDLFDVFGGNGLNSDHIRWVLLAQSKLT